MSNSWLYVFLLKSTSGTASNQKKKESSRRSLQGKKPSVTVAGRGQDHISVLWDAPPPSNSGK